MDVRPVLDEKLAASADKKKIETKKERRWRGGGGVDGWCLPDFVEMGAGGCERKGRDAAMILKKKGKDGRKEGRKQEGKEREGTWRKVDLTSIVVPVPRIHKNGNTGAYTAV